MHIFIWTVVVIWGASLLGLLLLVRWESRGQEEPVGGYDPTPSAEEPGEFVPGPDWRSDLSTSLARDRVGDA